MKKKLFFIVTLLLAAPLTIMRLSGTSGETEQQTTPTPPAIITAEGGLTVSEIIARRDDLAGKKIVIRGKVIKFMPQILKKNWLHIQDGTGGPETKDLTVTTDSNVNVGDTVLVKGTVSVNKDFGSGYYYEVIVEDATVSIE